MCTRARTYIYIYVCVCVFVSEQELHRATIDLEFKIRITNKNSLGLLTEKERLLIDGYRDNLIESRVTLIDLSFHHD